jgi:hypothetical protein
MGSETHEARRTVASEALNHHSLPSAESKMADNPPSHTRRYVRAVGPFNGFHLGLRKAPVLVFNLNVGGAFVTFTEEPANAATFVLTIDLHQEGRITAKAETVYRDPAGVAVRFVGLDAESCDRLARAVEHMREKQSNLLTNAANIQSDTKDGR